MGNRAVSRMKETLRILKGLWWARWFRAAKIKAAASEGREGAGNDGAGKRRGRRSGWAVPGRRAIRSSRGFTLAEALVSLLFLTLAAVTLLHGFGTALRSYQDARQRWQQSVELWNRAQEVRARAEPSPEPLNPLPGTLPLYRTWVEEEGTPEDRRLEVLHAP